MIQQRRPKMKRECFYFTQLWSDINAFVVCEAYFSDVFWFEHFLNVGIVHHVKHYGGFGNIFDDVEYALSRLV